MIYDLIIIFSCVLLCLFVWVLTLKVLTLRKKLAVLRAKFDVICKAWNTLKCESGYRKTIDSLGDDSTSIVKLMHFHESRSGINGDFKMWWREPK